MKNMGRLFIFIGCILLLSAISSAFAVDGTEQATVKNHAFVRVQIRDAFREVVDGVEHCHLEEGTEDYCSAEYTTAIKQALETGKPDFYGKFIIVVVDLKAFINVLAVDNTTGIAYPLPFDYVTGHEGTAWQGQIVDNPQLNYSLKDNKICISGITVFYERTLLDPCFEFTNTGDYGEPGFKDDVDNHGM